MEPLTEVTTKTVKQPNAVEVTDNADVEEVKKFRRIRKNVSEILTS